MSDTRFAVLTLPMEYESIAEPRELIVDFEETEIYVKSKDGTENVLVGSGRYGELRLNNQSGTFTEDTNTITIDMEGYDPEKDAVIWLYIGGVFKTLGVEYSIVDGVINNLEDEWLEGWDYNIVLIKNVRTMNFDIDLFDGSMIAHGTINDNILSNSTGQLKDRFNSHITNADLHNGEATSLILEDKEVPGNFYEIEIRNGVIVARAVD